MQRVANQLLQFFIPPKIRDVPDELRRAHLIIGFGVLGALFGMLYATFYLAVEHYVGHLIIMVCTLCFALVPILLRQTGSTVAAGNFHCLILIAGFFSLCWVEGGMHGHALAWLVVVPLCALLLVPQRAACVWAAISFLTAIFTAGVEFFGITPPSLYPPLWQHLITTAGYGGLIAFMFLLGLLFENGRRAAHDKMEQTLKKLAEANTQLTRLNEDKSELLAIAAHDLKNPLTVVMGYSDRLAMGNMESANIIRIAKTISRESSRMRDLITTVLDLNAIEDGSKKIETNSVNLAQIIDLAIDHFRSVAEQKGIALSFEPSDPGTEAFCDRQAVLQVLDNLISNGLKFSQSGTQVSILCGTHEGRAFLKVADQGPGISEEDQKQLFRKFTRLSAQPTGGESSSGLGLSIVKRLLQSMSGEIKCESQVGRGTTFTVYLPVPAVPMRQEWTTAKPRRDVPVEREPALATAH